MSSKLRCCNAENRLNRCQLKRGRITLTFIGANEGFVFHGKTGRGKSHLATAVGIAAIDAGMAARFFTAAQLVMMLAKANRAGLLDVQMKDIAKSDLVILDEFGYVPIDIEGARLLFQFEPN